MIRKVAKWAALIVLGVVATILLYGLAALICALAPIRGRPQSVGADDPALFVCASLAHTDIVVPIGDDVMGLQSIFFAVAGDVPDSAYLAIGWGDFAVYHDTPRWSDLRAGTALRALAGLGPTTLHVVAVNKPRAEGGCVKIAVDRAGRQAMARFMLATAENDPSGFPRLLDSPRAGEAFYAAGGRYSPWRTCNVWASEALAAAGMPVARWAPLSFGVTWPLKGGGA